MAAVVGLPFGLLMLAFAVLGGDSDVTNVSPSAGGGVLAVSDARLPETRPAASAPDAG